MKKRWWGGEEKGQFTSTHAGRDLGKVIHPSLVKSGKPELVKLQNVTYLGHITFIRIWS